MGANSWGCRGYLLPQQPHGVVHLSVGLGPWEELLDPVGLWLGLAQVGLYVTVVLRCQLSQRGQLVLGTRGREARRYSWQHEPGLQAHNRQV